MAEILAVEEDRINQSRKLLDRLRWAVLRTRKGNALDTVVYHLVRDAHHFAQYDLEHRREHIGRLDGAWQMSAALPQSDPVVQVYQKVLVVVCDILEAKGNMLEISERRVPHLIAALKKFEA